MLGLLLCREADDLRMQTLRDRTFDTFKSAATDEEDITGVDMNKLLIRMLASSLRRYVHNRSFEHLQQALLHSFSAHVTRDGHILALAGYLIDLIDEDDTSLSLGDVVFGILQQTDEDGLHVFAYITGLGEGSSVGDSKRHFEQLGYCTGEKGLAGTG